MLKKYEKYIKFGIKLLQIALIVLSIYVLIKYLLPFFAPFVVAIIIAFINEPVVLLLEKLKVPRKLGSIISLLFTICVMAVIITLGVIKIYNELVSLQGNVTIYSDKLVHYTDQFTAYYKNLPVDISSAIKQGVISFIPQAKSLVAGTVTYLIETIKSVPKMAIFIIMTLLSTYFISSDMKKIKSFLYKQIPKEWTANFTGLKTDTIRAMIGYFKALLLLMAITFIEVCFGLIIISTFVTKVDYILVLALIVALSDAIPVLGTGIVMIPWILWSLIIGNPAMAIGLLIIYVTGVVVRQILEPKIVGDQLGLHPLATLLAIFIGLEVFGILGFFVGPITMIILKSFQTTGILKIWNE